MSEAVLLPIELLRFTEKKRRGICSRRVEELRRLIEMDRDVFPICVRRLHDGTYVVRDGRHRIKAHLAAGINLIAAIVENTTNTITNIITKLLRKIFQG